MGGIITVIINNNYKNNNDNNSWFKHKYTAVFEGETPEVISIRRAS